MVSSRGLGDVYKRQLLHQCVALRLLCALRLLGLRRLHLLLHQQIALLHAPGLLRLHERIHAGLDLLVLRPSGQQVNDAHGFGPH